MKIQKSGLGSSGKTQPKNDAKSSQPYTGQRWKDTRGQGVTVTGASLYRVKFVRDGYEFSCEMPTARFLKDFTLVVGSRNV